MHEDPEPTSNSEQDTKAQVQFARRFLLLFVIPNAAMASIVLHLAHQHLMSKFVIGGMITLMALPTVSVILCLLDKAPHFSWKTSLINLTATPLMLLAVIFAFYTKTTEIPITSLYTFTLDETFSIDSIDENRFEIIEHQPRLIKVRDKTEPQTTVEVLLDSNNTISRVTTLIDPIPCAVYHISKSTCAKKKNMPHYNRRELSKKLLLQMREAIDDKYGRRDTWIVDIDKFDGNNTLYLTREDEIVTVTITNKLPPSLTGTTEEREALVANKINKILNN